MSDEDKNGASDANIGVSLPGDINAAYNIGLSPLFANKIGGVGITDKDRGNTGRAQEFYASTVYSARGSYYLYIWYSGTQPNGYYATSRGSVFSLRCLVSTTNS